jgi:HlyD family secretion protein
MIRSAEAQLRVAEAMLQTALANVGQQEAAVRQAQVDLDHTEIRAPVDGVVVSRTVDVGQTVAASLQAPTLFTIAQDLTDMQVDTNVDEADVGRIRVGLGATFTVDAFRSQTFSGEVMQVRKAPQTVQNVVTYNVVVSARNPDGRLLPGMTANVRLVVDRKESVLKAPNAALRFRPPGEAAETLAAAGAGPSGAQGASPSLEQIRDRLVKSLGLTPEQQKKLEPILQEGRDRFRALTMRNPTEGERRIEGQKIRESSREQIRAFLTPEQRGKYDQQLAEQAGARAGSSGRVFIPGPDGKPKAVTVQLGISDGNFTEIVGSELKDGQEVITGTGDRPGAARPASGPRLQ